MCGRQDSQQERNIEREPLLLKRPALFCLLKIALNSKQKLSGAELEKTRKRSLDAASTSTAGSCAKELNAELSAESNLFERPAVANRKLTSIAA